MEGTAMATTYYHWDRVSGNVVSESDETGATTAVYTHRPEQYGKLISQRRGGVSSYHYYDGQGSTRALTDSSGNVTDTSTYTAFGETVQKTGSTTNPFGFKGAVGYYANPVTNDLYVRARTYTPRVARWLSVDPRHPSIGKYNYVKNNPVALLDPSGLQAREGHIQDLMRLGLTEKEIRELEEGVKEFLESGKLSQLYWQSLQRIFFILGDPIDTDDRGVTKRYCDARKQHPDNRWLLCACRVSRLIDVALAGIVLARLLAKTAAAKAEHSAKIKWYRCMRSCMVRTWQVGQITYDGGWWTLDPRHQAMLTEDWKCYAKTCQGKEIKKPRCCHLQVEDEQKGFTACAKNKCGPWKWGGNVFPIVILPGWIKGQDFNDETARIKYGYRLCCDGSLEDVGIVPEKIRNAK